MIFHNLFGLAFPNVCHTTTFRIPTVLKRTTENVLLRRTDIGTTVHRSVVCHIRPFLVYVCVSVCARTVLPTLCAPRRFAAFVRACVCFLRLCACSFEVRARACVSTHIGNRLSLNSGIASSNSGNISTSHRRLRLLQFILAACEQT